MNIIPTSQAEKRISSENASATQRMADKNILLEMMSELIATTAENRITIDAVEDHRSSRRSHRTSTSTVKEASLQSFFDREKHEIRRHQNSIGSDEQCEDMSDKVCDDSEDDDDDDLDEFYEDDQDAETSMMKKFQYHSPPCSNRFADRHVSSTNNSDLYTHDDWHSYQSPQKRYSSSSISKPKYDRHRMDAKQLDTLSTSLHTSDGTEVTATETDYSLSGSSHHSHSIASMRSPYYHCLRPATVYGYTRSTKVVTTSTLDIQVPNILSLLTHRLLGEGYFGKVYLVSDQNGKNENFLALKTISKYHLICEDQVHTVMSEKEILRLCSHPNIVTLFATQQDASSLYLLQSFIPGGDFFNMIHHFDSTSSDSDGTMSKSERHPILSDEINVQFYVACITDALWYLHCGLSNTTDHMNRSVVYRDLKHENIMINERGYPILIDFGYSKILEGNATEASATTTRTYTMCGTAKYVSPEIIEGIGHTCSTDYWSLGVVTYELLLCGREHPFEYMTHSDDLSLYRNVVEAGYTPLPDGISTEGIDFVDKLLIKDGTSRLGTTESRTYNPILLHPWLRKWDVSLLRQQSYDAPWIPTLQNPLDQAAKNLPAQRVDVRNQTDEIEYLLTFDMDQQTDPNLTVKEQAMFAGF